MTLVAFVLTLLVWNSDGSLSDAAVIPFVSAKACETVGSAFEVKQREDFASSEPAFKGSWHWDCRPIFNTSSELHA